MPVTARHPILYQSGIVGAWLAGKSPGTLLPDSEAGALGVGVSLEPFGSSTSSTLKTGIAGGPLLDAIGSPVTTEAG